MRALDRRQHAGRHLPGVHSQRGVHAGHHDVEFAEEVEVAVEGAVLEDVDLHAGQDAERCELLVQVVDEVELLGEALLVEPVRDGEPGAVVGQDEVLAAQVAGRLGHLEDGAAAVRPVGVGMAVTAE